MMALPLYKPLQLKLLFPCIIMLCYVFVFVLALRTYITWQSVNLVIGFISLPLTTTINPLQKASSRFGVMACIVLVLMLLTPVKTMLYFSLVFAVLFVVESFAGRLNMLPLLSCLLMSPFFQFVVGVFGFPIRIELTKWAGNAIRLFEKNIAVAGNVLSINGEEFSVDPACMGLNMIVVSLLTGIILVGIYQKRFQRKISFVQLITLLASILLLNVISNLVRIIVLVQFRIMPENVMHDIAGLLCLLSYVLLPAILLTKWVIKKHGAALTNNRVAKSAHPNYTLHLILLAGIAVFGYRIIMSDDFVNSHTSGIKSIEGYSIEMIKDHVIKAENKQALIYIKPIPGFYNADHNPLICWKGSGYEFKQIEEAVFNNHHVYTGTLQKGEDILYTAWWFDNGAYQTSSQMDWRWKMLCGSQPFALVNVTASSEDVLKAKVEAFLEKRISSKMLNKITID